MVRRIPRRGTRRRDTQRLDTQRKGIQKAGRQRRRRLFQLKPFEPSIPWRRLRRNLAAAATFILLAVLVQSQATAQTPDIIRRLQKEPLTLFDWGMANLDRDLRLAVRRLGEEDYVPTPPKSSTTYRWSDGRIRLSASFFVPPEARTAEACSAQFKRLVAALVRNAPQGPGAASWYLRNVFQPSGHFWASRFEDTGAKLLKVVTLRISLLAQSYEKLAGDSRRVDCSGPLNATAEALEVEATS